MASTKYDNILSELESMQARIRQLLSLLVSLDGYDRWGDRCDPGFAEQARRDTAELPQLRLRLEARIFELRLSNPSAVVAWAQAHVAVLEHCIENGHAQSVATWVAKTELREWRQLAAGVVGFVEENCVHVRPDATVYENLFGMPPPALHW